MAETKKMFSRGALAAGAALALALGLAACSSGGGSTDQSGGQAGDEIPGLLKQGTLSICGINDYPPMQYPGPNGDLIGFDIDSIKAVADELGLALDYQVMAFEGTLPAMNAGRCDAVWSAMFLNDERQEVADAIPYLRTSAEILVAYGNPLGIAGPEDLSGKRVAVQSQTLYLPMMEELNAQFEAEGKPLMELQQYTKTSDVFQQVSLGRADAAIEADIALAYLVSQNPETYDRVPYTEEKSDAMAIYVQQGSPLRQVFSDALNAILDNGTWAPIAERYELSPTDLEIVREPLP